MATASVKVSVHVRDEASTTFLAYACYASIFSGAFDRFLPQLDQAIKNRRRALILRGVAANDAGEGR